MRPIVTLVLAGWALLTFAPAAIAQTGTPEFDPLGEFDNLPRMIRVQVEYIDIPHEKLTELMWSDAAKSDRALRKAVAELIRKGTARIVDTQMVIARPGQKATSESVEEYIYPTEYEPAATVLKTPKVAREGEEQEETGTYTVGPTPTAFEQRNLGSTLEVEPNLGANDKIIDLRFAPEIVYHVRDTVWGEWKDERGDASIRMPVIYSARVSTGVTLVSGEPLLVAALTPKDDQGTADFTRKLMIFVRASVVSPGR